jgi:hypothetical protein
VFNVVDLQHCKSHFSYYTCLSRSSTAACTAIVQAFATTAITKGIAGYLCQEFRELELLNEITEGKYSCTLPPTVTGVTRSDLLRSYQEFKGKDYDPKDLHSALAWRAGDPPKLPDFVQQSQRTLVGKDNKADEKNRTHSISWKAPKD